METATVHPLPLRCARRAGPSTLLAIASALVLGSCGSDDPVGVAQTTTDMVFTDSPDHSWVDQPLGTIEIRLFDSNGLVADRFTGPVTLSIGDNPRSATLAGQVMRDAVAGIASFPGVSLDKPGAGYTLVATADALSAESDAFNVTPPSLYVGDYGVGPTAVSVVDLATRSVLDSVTVGSGPRAIAITPDGLFAYATGQYDDVIAVIETAGNTVVGTIDLLDPGELRMSPDGGELYVTRQDGIVFVIETAGNTVVDTIAVGSGPTAIAFTPDGEFAYVANGNSENVSVIRTATRSVVDTVLVGGGPGDAIVTPDGSKVYVTYNDGVAVISTATNAVIGSIAAGVGNGLATITPDGAAVFVASYGDDAVVRIATATDMVSDTITVGDGPFALVAGPAGEFVYVANANAGTISVVDVASRMVTGTITIGGRPGNLAVVPEPIR